MSFFCFSILIFVFRISFICQELIKVEASVCSNRITLTLSACPCSHFLVDFFKFNLPWRLFLLAFFKIKIIKVIFVLKAYMLSKFTLTIKYLFADWVFKFLFEGFYIFCSNNFQNLFILDLEIHSLETVDHGCRLSGSLKNDFFFTKKSKWRYDSNLNDFSNWSIIIHSSEVGKGKYVIVFF